MQTTDLAPTLDLSGQFVAALQSEDLPALRALVLAHGTEVPLCFSSQDDDDNECSTTVEGTALSVACHLQKEALAVYLVQAGAAQRAVSVFREGWFGWNSHTVLPIEPATSFGMKALSLALMRAEPSVDWSFRAISDSDDQCAGYPTPCLFSICFQEPKLVAFLENLGLFQGTVAAHPVRISKATDGFEVYLDHLFIGSKNTLKEGLELLRSRLEALGASFTR